MYRLLKQRMHVKASAPALLVFYGAFASQNKVQCLSVSKCQRLCRHEKGKVFLVVENILRQTV
jgi:hypothetical protein